MNNQINSMDNPKITSWNLMGIGDSFVYKGNYCTVTQILGFAFRYKIQNSTTTGYMTFKHYTTTPSYKSKNKIARFKYV